MTIKSEWNVPKDRQSLVVHCLEPQGWVVVLVFANIITTNSPLPCCCDVNNSISGMVAQYYCHNAGRMKHGFKMMSVRNTQITGNINLF